MKHITPVQIRFKDTDKLGHVNNANHFTYFELARMKYFDDVIGTKIDWQRTGLILASVKIDYKLPILLDDSVTVKTCCSRLGTKSFDLSHQIILDSSKVAAEGNSVVVCYDYVENRTIAVPEEWAKKVEAYDEISRG